MSFSNGAPLFPVDVEEEFAAEGEGVDLTDGASSICGLLLPSPTDMVCEA